MSMFTFELDRAGDAPFEAALSGDRLRTASGKREPEGDLLAVEVSSLVVSGGGVERAAVSAPEELFCPIEDDEAVDVGRGRFGCSASFAFKVEEPRPASTDEGVFSSGDAFEPWALAPAATRGGIFGRRAEGGGAFATRAGSLDGGFGGAPAL